MQTMYLILAKCRLFHLLNPVEIVLQRLVRLDLDRLHWGVT